MRLFLFALSVPLWALSPFDPSGILPGKAMQVPGNMPTAIVSAGLPPTPVLTYSKTTWVPEDGSSVASITSQAITLGSGDFVVMMCRGNTTTATITASSTPSNSVTALSPQTDGAGGNSIRTFYFPTVSSGSTTFTCSFSPNVSFTGMVVLDYTNTGSTPVLDTSASSSGNSTSIAGASFSTSAAALIVFCASVGGNNSTFSANSIGANTGVLQGANSMNGNSQGIGNPEDSACEDTKFSSAQSSITANMGYGFSHTYATTVMAFK